MRVTVVPADRMVAIDGVVMRVDISDLPGVHAMQWYGSRGEIEYLADDNGNRPLNSKIDNFTPFEDYVEAWREAKVAHDEMVAREERKRQEAARNAARQNG